MATTTFIKLSRNHKETQRHGHDMKSNNARLMDKRDTSGYTGRGRQVETPGILITGDR